jgi:hypothetical protein
MEITISGHRITLYNEVSINLKFDSIADTFGFRLYFNPDSVVDKKIFKPLSYYPCTITHGKVLLMTGTVLMHSFMSAGDPPKQLVYISGYSKTGVLQDSCLLNTIWLTPGTADGAAGGISIMKVSPNGSVTLNDASFQYNGMTLTSIVRAVTSWYELGEPVVDPELAKDPIFNTPYDHMLPPKPNTKVADFLDMLCKQKDVILSHTAGGKVLLTRQKAGKLLTTSRTIITKRENILSSPKMDVFDDPGTVSESQIVKTSTTDRKVLYNFKENDPLINVSKRPDGSWTGMSIDYNGQEQHTVIQVVGEQNNTNAADAALVNPYVAAGVPRYVRIIQTSGTDNDTPLTARSALKDELKDIVLIIDIHGWTLGGHLVTPNQLVTVTNKDLYLYGVSTWFIQEVSFYGDHETERATLVCVVPECFNDDVVVNRLF